MPSRAVAERRQSARHLGVFRERGYDANGFTAIYGYFDNMNASFSGNGFTVVDRTVMQPEDHVLEYLGRVCDETSFARAIGGGRFPCGGQAVLQLHC